MTAEVDLAAPDTPDVTFRPPDYCLAEVSADERFTGGRLAATNRATLLGFLDSVACRVRGVGIDNEPRPRAP